MNYEKPQCVHYSLLPLADERGTSRYVDNGGVLPWRCAKDYSQQATQLARYFLTLFRTHVHDRDQIQVPIEGLTFKAAYEPSSVQSKFLR